MSSFVRHLRRYVVWYGIAVVWAVLMASVPVVKHHAATLASRPHARTITTEIPAPAPAPVVAGEAVALPPPPAPLPTTPVTAAPAPAGRAPTPTPTPAPAPPPGLQLPALPPLPFPAVPDQVQPLLDAVSPLMKTGCSAIGLAAVVVAVVAPTVQQVPLDQLMPYLVPAYTVCALFPIPKSHTVCPVDEQIAAQLPASLTSLFPAPTVMGLGIDVIAGMEAAAQQAYGIPIPTLSDSLRTQLGCHIET